MRCFRTPLSSFVVIATLLVGGALLVGTTLYVRALQEDRTAYQRPSSSASLPAGRPAVTHKALVRWLGGMAILVLVFAVGTFALVRFSRRFREFLFRQRAAATPTDDVWGQVRLGDEPFGDIRSPKPLEPESDEQ